MAKDSLVSRNLMRRLIADYMASEGCDCCQNVEEHAVARAAIGKLLKIPPYSDGSGYDFSKFTTEATTKKGKKK